LQTLALPLGDDAVQPFQVRHGILSPFLLFVNPLL